MRSLVLHYHRSDHLYLDWDLWLWPSSPQSHPGRGYVFLRQDEYGVTFQIQVAAAVSQVGFVYRRGGDNWTQKDLAQDRFIPLSGQVTEVWTAAGHLQVFRSYEQARQFIFPEVMKAYLDAPNRITMTISPTASRDFLHEYFWVTDLMNSDHWKCNPVTSSSDDRPIDSLQLLLPDFVDVTHPHVVSGAVAKDTAIVPRNVLDQPAFRYSANDLGCLCNATASHFRLWAPTAKTVTLHIADENQTSVKTTPMLIDANGTWAVTLDGDWHEFHYRYQLEIHQSITFAVDPYTKGLSPDRTWGIIIDSARAQPPDWESDHGILMHHATDAIIYETHLRDYSAHRTSGAAHSGRYIQFLKQGMRTTDGLISGIDHILELGVTHVQFLPICEFGRYEEYNPDEYNWGYDPRFYLVPEGRYATTRNGVARIVEAKQMVQALHHHGIGVIMDVVFNHAFHPTASTFHKIVPEYYFRTRDDGSFSNGAGVGNELACERPMVRKFITDALLYWLTEYHVDGFRFDLMALIGKSTMLTIAAALRAVRPDVLLYGEPWAAGASSMVGDTLFDKGVQRGTGIAVFNDHLRDALLGPVFDRNIAGYVGGNFGTIDAVKRGVVGSVAYNGQASDFASEPVETINYVSCHDNLTLWDRIQINDPWETERTRIAMDRLTQAIILVSQGIPFLQSGEEFLRTKHGKENTYLDGDFVNAMDWHRKLEYFPVFSYYKGLIQLRREHPAFRMSTALQVNAHLEFLALPPPLLGWVLKDHANGDAWKHILVAINPTRTVVHVALPDGIWIVVAENDRAGTSPLGFVEKLTEVAPVSCTILYQ